MKAENIIDIGNGVTCKRRQEREERQKRQSIFPLSLKKGEICLALYRKRERVRARKSKARAMYGNPTRFYIQDENILNGYEG